MSDSEYCNYEDVYVEAPVPTKTQNKNLEYSDSEDTVVLEKPLPKKRKAHASKRSDSEDTVVLEKPLPKKRKAHPSKRSNTEEIKQKAPAVKKRKTPTAERSGEITQTEKKHEKQEASSSKTKPEKFDLFGIVSEEEAGQRQTPCELQSVLTTRVANGTVTRRKLISGEFYVEIKVYKTADAISTSIDDRWKKVLTSLKIQVNADGDEWKQLQGFFKTIHSSMSDTESTFYANKSF